MFDKETRLGGQANLAQLLPGRSEFGGIVTNLSREIELAGIGVTRGVEVTLSLIETHSPDAVILATGTAPQIPDVELSDDAHVVDA